MSFCRIHGRYSDIDDGCPVCQTADDLAATDRAETLALLGRLSSPGDYVCPHCKYKSLKQLATRCPLCHGQVELQYWERVDARETAAALEAERRQRDARAEYERARPARERAAVRARIADRIGGTIKAVVLAPLGFLYGGFLGICGGMVLWIATLLAVVLTRSERVGAVATWFEHSGILVIAGIGALIGVIVAFKEAFE